MGRNDWLTPTGVLSPPPPLPLLLLLLQLRRNTLQRVQLMCSRALAHQPDDVPVPRTAVEFLMAQPDDELRDVSPPDCGAGSTATAHRTAPPQVIDERAATSTRHQLVDELITEHTPPAHHSTKSTERFFVRPFSALTLSVR